MQEKILTNITVEIDIAMAKQVSNKQYQLQFCSYFYLCTYT